MFMHSLEDVIVPRLLEDPETLEAGVQRMKVQSNGNG
jgi:hypothetical protein